MLMLYLSAIEAQEDKDKFEQIYLKYRQTMYAVAYDILKNKTDAEDAVHQSFLKIANDFDNISRKSYQEIKPYLLIICRNTAIDMYRANKRALEKNIYMEQNEIPDITTLENADYDRLYSAIKDLSQIYKDVLYLYEFMGYSAKETAELLNITTDVVYKRLGRARKMLKSSLEKGEAHIE